MSRLVGCGHFPVVVLIEGWDTATSPKWRGRSGVGRVGVPLAVVAGLGSFALGRSGSFNTVSASLIVTISGRWWCPGWWDVATSPWWC
ncbi:hypothetical protein AB0M37_11580 [Micromonospora chalcea]